MGKACKKVLSRKREQERQQREAEEVEANRKEFAGGSGSESNHADGHAKRSREGNTSNKAAVSSPEDDRADRDHHLQGGDAHDSLPPWGYFVPITPPAPPAPGHAPHDAPQQAPSADDTDRTGLLSQKAKAGSKRSEPCSSARHPGEGEEEQEEVVLKEKKRKKKSVGERVKRETLPDMARRVTAGDTLRPCLSMPLERAAKELRVSTTTLKRICRHLDIQSWPYRQIAGINRTIVRLEAELEESIRSLVPCPLGGPVGEGSSASRAISEHIKDLVDHREQIINMAMEGAQGRVDDDGGGGGGGNSAAAAAGCSANTTTIRSRDAVANIIPTQHQQHRSVPPSTGSSTSTSAGTSTSASQVEGEGEGEDEDGGGNNMSPVVVSPSSSAACDGGVGGASAALVAHRQGQPKQTTAPQRTNYHDGETLSGAEISPCPSYFHGGAGAALSGAEISLSPSYFEVVPGAAAAAAAAAPAAVVFPGTPTSSGSDSSASSPPVTAAQIMAAAAAVALRVKAAVANNGAPSSPYVSLPSPPEVDSLLPIEDPIEDLFAEAISGPGLGGEQQAAQSPPPPPSPRRILSGQSAREASGGGGLMLPSSPSDWSVASLSSTRHDGGGEGGRSRYHPVYQRDCCQQQQQQKWRFYLRQPDGSPRDRDETDQRQQELTHQQVKSGDGDGDGDGFASGSGAGGFVSTSSSHSGVSAAPRDQVPPAPAPAAPTQSAAVASSVLNDTQGRPEVEEETNVDMALDEVASLVSISLENPSQDATSCHAAIDSADNGGGRGSGGGTGGGAGGTGYVSSGSNFAGGYGGGGCGGGGSGGYESINVSYNNGGSDFYGGCGSGGGDGRGAARREGEGWTEWQPGWIGLEHPSHSSSAWNNPF